MHEIFTSVDLYFMPTMLHVAIEAVVEMKMKHVIILYNKF